MAIHDTDSGKERRYRGERCLHREYGGGHSDSATAFNRPGKCDADARLSLTAELEIFLLTSFLLGLGYSNVVDLCFCLRWNQRPHEKHLSSRDKASWLASWSDRKVLIILQR